MSASVNKARIHYKFVAIPRAILMESLDNPEAKAVLRVWAYAVTRDFDLTQEFYLPIRGIANRLHITRATVRASIEALTQSGWIVPTGTTYRGARCYRLAGTTRTEPDSCTQLRD